MVTIEYIVVIIKIRTSILRRSTSIRLTGIYYLFPLLLLLNLLFISIKRSTDI